MAVDLMERQATLDDVFREVSRLKEFVSDAVNDGMKSAVRTIRQGRHVAENVIDDTRHAVRRNPFQSMGIVFAAGVMTGAFVAWLGARRN